MTDIPQQELDLHFAIGFIQTWVDNKPEIKEYVDTVIGGVDYYRNKLYAVSEDYDILNKRYNDLTALSSGYLSMIQQQKEQIDQLLIDQQRDFHKEQE